MVKRVLIVVADAKKESVRYSLPCQKIDCSACTRTKMILVKGASKEAFQIVEKSCRRPGSKRLSVNYKRIDFNLNLGNCVNLLDKARLARTSLALHNRWRSLYFLICL
jgi:hypothetical protein